MSRIVRAAKSVIRAEAEGRTPSLADHFALGTVGQLDPWFEKRAAYPFQNDSEAPSVSETSSEPLTTRPRPGTTPQPPAQQGPGQTEPLPADPVPPVEDSAQAPPAEPDMVPGSPEAVMAVRAMLSNPGMELPQARALAREAMGYIRRAEEQS